VDDFEVICPAKSSVRALHAARRGKNWTSGNEQRSLTLIAVKREMKKTNARRATTAVPRRRHTP
jgi:hypothetical protein